MSILSHLDPTSQQDFFTELGILIAAAILCAGGLSPERAAIRAKALEVMVRSGPPEVIDDRHTF